MIDNNEEVALTKNKSEQGEKGKIKQPYDR
jgi:hypothetical protein